MKQLVTLRKRVLQCPDEGTVASLLALIGALKDSVSALKERKHDSLLGEVLGIPLWTCHEVRRMAAALLQP